MRLLVSSLAASLLGLVATPRAQASGCYFGPYTTTLDPPVGCEVVYYEHGAGNAPPVVGVKRGGVPVDLTPTVTTNNGSLEAFYTNYACDGSVLQDWREDEAYTVSRVTLSGAEVGDEIQVGSLAIGVVTAAGTCTEDFLGVSPGCTGRNSGYPCDDSEYAPDHDHDHEHDRDYDGPKDAVGCSAGGGSAGIALGALGLLWRRRRRIL